MIIHFGVFNKTSSVDVNFIVTENDLLWVDPLILCILLLLIPLWWVLTYRNKHTRDVLYTGWTPVIGAMVISRWVWHPSHNDTGLSIQRVNNAESLFLRQWWLVCEYCSHRIVKRRKKCMSYYIMADGAFVVVKEVFIMETVVFWPCHNG